MAEPKTAAHFYPTLVSAGVGTPYHENATMGSGTSERIVGDRWLAMIHIEPSADDSGSNIAFDMEQTAQDEQMKRHLDRMGMVIPRFYNTCETLSSDEFQF